MNRELICISCPVGCRLTAVIENKEVVSVTGNTCTKGVEYAKNECVDPKRTVTTIAKVEGREMPLPVKTSCPIKKEYMTRCVHEVKKLALKPPIKIGDVIIADIFGTGVDIVATANAER